MTKIIRKICSSLECENECLRNCDFCYICLRFNNVYDVKNEAETYEEIQITDDNIINPLVDFVTGDFYFCKSITSLTEYNKKQYEYVYYNR